MNIQIICFLLLVNITNFEGSNESPQNKVDSIALLKQAYNERNYDTFFNLFPDSFSKFIEYYGYVGNEPMPLYPMAYEHIDYLVSNKSCKHRLLTKLFNIAKNAIWEADAPNYLRSSIIGLVVEHPKIILSLLKNEETKIVENFWYFILYYPSLKAEYDLEHQEQYKQIYTCINGENAQMGNTIKRIYDRIVIESYE